MKRLGKIITDIDLKENVSEDVISQIENDIHDNILLIFKNQGIISGDRQVEISKWFGGLLSTVDRHPMSPHPHVYRMSNNENAGYTNVGRTGWHIDGSFIREPFKFSIYHMVSVAKQGDTAFVSLKELLESLAPKTRERWERLHIIRHNRKGRIVHPLVYPHPVTKQSTMCFHLGMTDAYIWDKGTEKERITEMLETSNITQEIHSEIVKDDGRLIYYHKWEEGDFIISDNLAVGHEATPETQFPESEIGLRVLHRTTVKGTNRPTKYGASFELHGRSRNSKNKHKDHKHHRLLRSCNIS